MEKQVKKFKEIDYVQRNPENFSENEKYPAIILLHGAGGRGRNTNLVMTNPYFTETEKFNHRAVSFAPQCYANTWFDMFEQLQEFIEFAINQPYVDKERVYLFGASMGGYAAWQMAMTHPEWFAAIVPICGGGMYWNAERLKNVSVWAFHGEVDDVVFPEESRKMVDYVNMKGGNAKLTIVEGVCHNSWLNAYNSPELFDWLFAQKLHEAYLGDGGFNDVERFG